MVFLSFLKDMWCEVFMDFYLIAKIILAPLFVVFSLICLFLMGFEFILFDFWVCLLALCSKHDSIKSWLEFFFN